MNEFLRVRHTRMVDEIVGKMPEASHGAEAPSVLLFVETSREFGRGLLHGIAKYSRLHGPWRVYRWTGRWIPRCRNGSI